MKSEEFLEAINADLIDTAYVTDVANVNGGLPLFIFERNVATGVPGDLPVALLDVDSGKIYSSKFSYNGLKDYASKPELRRIKERLTTLATKSELNELEDSLETLATKQELQAVQQLIPIIVQTALNTSDWAEENGLIYQDIQSEGVTSSSTVMLIPQSSDSFTYNLAIGTLSNGFIRITASSLPQSDVNIGLLVAG